MLSFEAMLQMKVKTSRYETETAPHTLSRAFAKPGGLLYVQASRVRGGTTCGAQNFGQCHRLYLRSGRYGGS